MTTLWCTSVLSKILVVKHINLQSLKQPSSRDRIIKRGVEAYLSSNTTAFITAEGARVIVIIIVIVIIVIIIIIIINPLTARVVGAPQIILQPIFSIFPCSALPSGTCRTPGLFIPDVVFPPLPLSALSSSRFHCALQDGFGQT